MKEKQLQEMTLEELKAKENKLKLIIGIFIGIFVVLLAASLFLMNKKGGFVASTTLPGAFIPVLVIMGINMKKVKDEITARG